MFKSLLLIFINFDILGEPSRNTGGSSKKAGRSNQKAGESSQSSESFELRSEVN